MLGALNEDIAMRLAPVEGTPPQFDLTAFPVRPAPQRVWESTDGTVSVDAVEVHHEPVTGAVAYRVRTAEGIVVISGDTVVCDEVAEMSAGADVLVLTHLVPPPDDAASAVLFEDAVRSGGYRGRVTFGEDLSRVTFGSS
jgi:ribonuclease Z